MKRLIKLATFVVIILGSFAACAVQKTTAQQDDAAILIRDAVENSEFRFVAERAQPTSFRSVFLSAPFDVRVLPDTVQVHLPFFGRAFRALMNPSEGGYNFTSTDFEYSVTPGRRAGNWLVQIVFNDLHSSIQFNFDIWDSGSANLRITDVNRESISFQGRIEL